MYPIDFYKSKNYWQILGLPTVNKDCRVSDKMSMQIIKRSIIGELDYTITKLESDIQNGALVISDLDQILDVVNAYLTFRDPILFYKYNCYLTNEDAYETSDPYCGYRYIYANDFNPDRQQHFIKVLEQMQSRLRKDGKFILNNIATMESLKVENILDAIIVGLDDVITTEKIKGTMTEIEPDEIYGNDYARTNGLKLK